MAVSVHLVALSVHLVDTRLTFLAEGSARSAKKIWWFHFLLYLCCEIIKAKMKPKHHAMKPTSPTTAIDLDGHDRQNCRMSLFTQAASPPDTGGFSMSRSIAITLPAAMLRPLPQTPAGGKKHASLDPPPKRGQKKRKGGGTGLDTLCYHLSQGHGLSGRARSLCSHLSQVMAFQAMTYPCLSRTKEHPSGCSFVLRSASCYVRVGYFYKLYVRKNK